MVGRRLGKFGLTGGAALALIAIARESRQGNEMHQVALAGAMGISDSSLVRFVDQLCESSLVNRFQDEANRRAKKVVVTPRGRLLATQLEDELTLMCEETLGELPPGELQVAERVAQTVVTAESTA